MIDAYLKTSMPVYDSLDRQNHRDECCKNEQFKLYTDRNHLPPFQLYIPDVDPVGLPLRVQVYDADTDNQLVAPDATALAIANLLIDIYSDAGNSWFVSGGFPLGALLMDTGKYYLIINEPLNDVNYYTEVFTVCDCEPVLSGDCDREFLTVYDTDERGSPDEIVKPNGSFGPMIYYYNNKSYCSWEQRGGIGYSCEGMIYAIYHESCFISESYGVGPGTLNASDPHAVPVLLVADDKHIVVAHERLTGAPGTYPPDRHNGYMQIKRSDNEEDETSWVNAIANFGDYFDEIGNEGAWRLSYPSLDKLANSKLFLFCRHSSAGELDRVSVHRSNDHGVSWDDLGGDIDGGCDVVDLSPPATGSDLIYKGLCKHPYNNSLHLMVWWKDAPNNNFPDLYYLESHDNGVNWQDISGGFVQNITTAGNNPIMKVNLDAGGNDFLVKHCINPESVSPVDGIITNTGIPYIVAFKGSAGVYDAFMYYWDGAAWVETDMRLTTTTTVGCVLTQRGDVLEIIFAAAQNGTFKRNVYRSPNLTIMDDWTLIKEIYEDTNETYTMNRSTGTFNYTVMECEAFVAMTNRNIGSYSDFYLSFDCAEAFTMCNHISLAWWHECDFDGIIYQFGYRNRLILDTVLKSPRVEIERSTKKRIGTLFSEWISHKEFYGIKIMLSKYAFYALSRLPLYADNEFGHVVLTLPNDDWAEIYEMTIDATWQTDNCYAEFMLDFIQDELIITNCCVDYDISEQVSE